LALADLELLGALICGGFGFGAAVAAGFSPARFLLDLTLTPAPARTLGSTSGAAGDVSCALFAARAPAARFTPDRVLDAATRVVLAELPGLRGILPPSGVYGLPPALSSRRRSSHKSADLKRRHRVNATNRDSGAKEMKMDKTGSRRWRIRAGTAAMAALALAGCSAIAPLTDQVSAGAHELIEASNLTPLGVNPSSPIAPDALKAEQVRGPVPSFASVPPAPGDVRAASAYKSEVVTLVADKRGLNQWSNANPAGIPDASITERYADAQRERVGHEPPVAPEKKGDTQAFVSKGRKAVGQTDVPAPAKSPN